MDDEDAGDDIYQYGSDREDSDDDDRNQAGDFGDDEVSSSSNHLFC